MKWGRRRPSCLCRGKVTAASAPRRGPHEWRTPHKAGIAGSDIHRAVDLRAGEQRPGGVDGENAAEVPGSLTGAPVQRGAFELFILALVAAAGLGLAVMLLQLALSAADREAALAQLATMGLGPGQRARLVLLEVLPGILAAGVAAVTCALLLPRIVAPAIDLSVFTGSTAAGSVVRVPLTTDAASFLLPIAGLVLGTAVTLGIEIQARRGVVATLRRSE